MIWLEPEFARLLPAPWESVDDALAVTGEVYREPDKARRRTLRFEVGGQGYFIKQHWGVGWAEIFKNLLTLKRPVLGAENEWLAINRLEQLGVDTMELAAFGIDRWNPARIRSFVVTPELSNTISLEDYCADWKTTPPSASIKRALIDKVADVARMLHDNGVNHRDFYICHFLLQLPWDGKIESLRLYLIDLHRVQIRRQTPARWRVRDLGALYFSIRDIGLSKRDLYRFMRRYSGKSLKDTLHQDQDLWHAVETRTWRLKQRKLKG